MLPTCHPVVLAKHGLSLTDVTLLQAFFCILVVVLEVPSRYAAD